MNVTFGFHPAAIVVALALAGALTWWVYRRTTPELSPVRRWLLAGLRFIGLALVILLLAEPVIRMITERRQDPVVALLLDSSKSLSPAVTNTEEVRARIDDVTSRLAQELDAEIRTYLFDTELVRLQPDADSIAFTGARTDIAAALAAARDDLRGEPLSSVVLVSDGLYNSGRNPIYVAETYPVPVHTVVVGDTTAHRDVLVQRVVANEVAYVNRTLPVRVTVRSDGIESQEAVVSITAGGRVVASERVRLPDGRGEVPVDLVFTPTSEGFRSYSVEVSPLEGELTESNNRASFSLRVLTRKLQVLLLAGAPSPDVATLSDLLNGDPDIEVAAVTQKGPSEYYGESLPTDLSTYDVIVLAGFPGRFSNPAAVDRIARSGQPVLFVLDHGTNLRLVRDGLGGAIPAVLRTIRSGFVEASAVPTSTGSAHPAMEVDAGPANIVRLPPLSYSQSLWEPTPDARTLATVAIRGIEIGDPLLVVRDRAGVRSAAILGAGLWRWRNVPEDLSDLETFSPELLSNLLRWMATEVDDRPVRVQPVQDFFDGGDVVRMTGQVYDESMNPAVGASVVVTVTDQDGNDFRYAMDAIGNGRFSTDLGQLDEGTYRFAAAAERQGLSLGADSGYFAVGELTLEYRDTRSDAALMRQIAARSGGEFSSAGDAGGIIGRIADGHNMDGARVTEVRDLPLRHVVPLLFVILTLFALEWGLRKRMGLV